MGRGGKRPGAGAPKGNLNGFKHGRNSQQHRKLLQLIARDPEVVAILIARAEHTQRRANRMRKQAEALITDLLERSLSKRSSAEAALYELNQRFRPPE
jgi:ribosomal protein L17